MGAAGEVAAVAFISAWVGFFVTVLCLDNYANNKLKADVLIAQALSKKQ